MNFIDLYMLKDPKYKVLILVMKGNVISDFAHACCFVRQDLGKKK